MEAALYLGRFLEKLVGEGADRRADCIDRGQVGAAGPRVRLVVVGYSVVDVLVICTGLGESICMGGSLREDQLARTGVFGRMN